MTVDRRSFLTLAAGLSAAGLATACETIPGLPVPTAPPANPRGREPDVKIGRIIVPRLNNLNDHLREGITLTTLDKGPGHWPGSAMPGGVGNCVIAGHRTTHSKPFRWLDRMVAGDQMELQLLDGTRFVYNWTLTETVRETEVERVVRQTNERTATLFACHPPGSARYRIVGRFTLA
jgi:sortase A